jgi:hypothetical protein
LASRVSTRNLGDGPRGRAAGSDKYRRVVRTQGDREVRANPRRLALYKFTRPPKVHIPKSARGGWPGHRAEQHLEALAWVVQIWSDSSSPLRTDSTGHSQASKARIYQEDQRQLTLQAGSLPSGPALSRRCPTRSELPRLHGAAVLPAHIDQLSCPAPYRYFAVAGHSQLPDRLEYKTVIARHYRRWKIVTTRKATLHRCSRYTIALLQQRCYPLDRSNAIRPNQPPRCPNPRRMVYIYQIRSRAIPISQSMTNR